MYQLNEKIKDLKPYDPIQGSYRVRLDANESFLPLPQALVEEAKAAVERTAFNRPGRPGAVPGLRRLLRRAAPAGGGGQRLRRAHHRAV